MVSDDDDDDDDKPIMLLLSKKKKKTFAVHLPGIRDAFLGGLYRARRFLRIVRCVGAGF